MATAQPTADPGDRLLGGEVVTFESAGPLPVLVTGELVVPAGDGPFPTVLFISGSGSQRRDGFQPPFAFGYDEIARTLVEAGLAVLLFDDRGTGGTPIGTDDPAEIGFDAVLGDARGAYDFLRQRPDVDPDRLVLFGHSEGGTTALVLATEQAPAALVLMSSPGRPLVEISVDQVLGLLPPDATEETRAAAEARQRTTLQAMIEDRIEEFEASEQEKVVMRAQAAYLRELAPHDPAALLAALAALEVPALVFQGDKDFQVLAAKDGAALAAAIDGHAASEYHLLADADHLLWDEPLDSAVERYLVRRPFHAGFLPAAAEWMTALLER